MAEACCDEPLAGPVASPVAAAVLGVRGFVALWRGERPRIGALTDDVAAVEALVAAGRLEVDEDGVLGRVHGLVSRSTVHEHGDGVAHTWCALDAIGIPAALAIDAVAVTVCPACGATLRVVIRHGVPEDDGGLRLWLPGGECTHLVEDFCGHANLYCDAGHLAAAMPVGMPGSRSRSARPQPSVVPPGTMWPRSCVDAEGDDRDRRGDE